MPKTAKEVAAAASGAHKPLATLNVGACLNLSSRGVSFSCICQKEEQQMASFITSRRHLVTAGAIAASALAARAAHAGEWFWRHRNRHWDDHDDGERHCF